MTATQILIGDDHPVVRHSIKAVLERHPGWHVCAEAENGEQALSKAAELKPDVVVLDLAMPVMNGLTAAREIHKSLPEVPIVIHTVYNFPKIQVEAKNAGVQAVTSKQDIGSLIQTIEALLNQGNARPH